MSNTDNQTNTDNTPKKRGRKKISEGGKPSPKKVFCVCAADESPVEEILCLNSNKDTTDEQVYAEAKASYQAKHGTEPTTVLGPYFQRMGGATPKRSSVLKDLSLETADLDPGKLGTAVFKDWNVSVRFLTDRDDAVYIMYKTHTKEDKKTKPTNKFVPKDALENLELIDSAKS